MYSEVHDSLIDALKEKHPLIFNGATPLVASTLPSGWFELTGQLFSSMTAILNHQELSLIHVLQIKEKFGSLRIRLDVSKLAYARQAVVRQLVDQAEQQSLSICPTCGGTTDGQMDCSCSREFCFAP